MADKDLALNNAPIALRWVNRSVQHVQSALGMYEGNMIAPDFRRWASNPATEVLRRHFRIRDQASLRGMPLRVALSQVIAVYHGIAQMLARAPQVFRDGEGEGDEAAYTNTPRDGFLYITPRYRTCGPLTQKHVLVHEGAHFTSESIQDYLRHPPQTFSEALLDAHAFSNYTFEVVNARSHRTDRE
jgi:hypothetical protein